MSPTTSSAIDSWRAELSLGFAHDGVRTVIAHKRHVGPLVVQRPFYPEGDVCHVYVVHPPGGIVGGDRLSLDVVANTNAHAVMTTPAATKFYRSLPDRYAVLSQSLRVRHNATLEWLPQETILFRDANARTEIRANLDEGARFIGWDLVCYGRPASGERFDRGRIRQSFEICVNDHPVLFERLRLDGTSDAMNAPWGIGGHTIMSTVLAYPAGPGDLEAARTHSAFACTLVDRVLSCRWIGDDADTAKRESVSLWKTLRPRIVGREAVSPRIWET